MPYLPHIYPEGATFFITFRLDDSLPQAKVQELKQEYEEQLQAFKRIEKDKQKIMDFTEKLRSITFGKYEHQLDEKPYGECYLKDPKIAEIVKSKILQYHNQYYHVKICCIMPNHVHMLLDTSIQLGNGLPYVQVGNWMKLIKGGSSYLINKEIGRTGKLWNFESYDHYVRDVTEYHRIRKYIAQNPHKAKLKDKYFSEPYVFGTDLSFE